MIERLCVGDGEAAYGSMWASACLWGLSQCWGLMAVHKVSDFVVGFQGLINAIQPLHMQTAQCVCVLIVGFAADWKFLLEAWQDVFDCVFDQRIANLAHHLERREPYHTLLDSA